MPYGWRRGRMPHAFLRTPSITCGAAPRMLRHRGWQLAGQVCRQRRDGGVLREAGERVLLRQGPGWGFGGGVHAEAGPVDGVCRTVRLGEFCEGDSVVRNAMDGRRAMLGLAV